MQINTEHFGRIEISDEDIITFPDGLPGFEDLRGFTLLSMGEEYRNLFLLQSVEKPEICFVVTDPFVIYNGYEVQLEDDDLELLGITTPDTVMTLAIVVIPEDPSDVRVNLKAPVIINVDRRLGKQVLQRDESLPIRYYLNRRTEQEPPK